MDMSVKQIRKIMTSDHPKNQEEPLRLAYLWSYRQLGVMAECLRDEDIEIMAGRLGEKVAEGKLTAGLIQWVRDTQRAWQLVSGQWVEPRRWDGDKRKK